MRVALDARTATDHFPGIGRYVVDLVSRRPYGADQGVEPARGATDLGTNGRGSVDERYCWEREGLAYREFLAAKGKRVRLTRSRAFHQSLEGRILCPPL